MKDKREYKDLTMVLIDGVDKVKIFAPNTPTEPRDYEAIVKKTQKWLDNIQVEPSWVDLFVLQDILNGRDT